MCWVLTMKFVFSFITELRSSGKNVKFYENRALNSDIVAKKIIVKAIFQE